MEGGVFVYDVFVICSSTDFEQAEELCAYLEQAGIPCWGDHRNAVLDPETGWPTSSAQAIKKARLAIALLSESAKRSQAVLREITSVFTYHIPFFTVQLGAPDTGTFQFRIPQTVQLDGESMAEAAPKVLAATKKALGVPESAVPHPKFAHDPNTLPVESGTAYGTEKSKERASETLQALNRIQFIAASPKKVKPDHYAEIQIYAARQEEQKTVLEMIEKEFGKGVYQTKESSFLEVEFGTSLKIILSSDDVLVEDNCEVIRWEGLFGKASFLVHVPKAYARPQIAFQAKVLVHDMPRCKLVFTIDLQVSKQKRSVHATPFEKAFASYAHEDREKVFARLQGMKHALPELDVFLDVLSLRSGEDWEKRIKEEIPRADIFFLFWSRNAKQSSWVDAEWRLAYDQKGIGFIEPVPLETPDIAPVPDELQSKHFNDLLLLMGKNPDA